MAALIVSHLLANKICIAYLISGYQATLLFILGTTLCALKNPLLFGLNCVNLFLVISSMMGFHIFQQQIPATASHQGLQCFSQFLQQKNPCKQYIFQESASKFFKYCSFVTRHNLQKQFVHLNAVQDANTSDRLVFVMCSAQKSVTILTTSRPATVQCALFCMSWHNCWCLRLINYLV